MIAIIPAFAELSESPPFYMNTLAGKGLIDYTIDAARNSKYINRIIISTDIIELSSKIANKDGVEVLFNSPTSLLKNDALLNDIIEQNNENVNLINDFIFLKPSFPLRTAQDIDSAYEIFLEKKTGSLISFCETTYSPVKTKRLVDNKMTDFFKETAEGYDGKEVDKAYFAHGAIFIINYEFYKKHGINYSENTLPFIMAYNHSIEVNNSTDLEFAEFLIIKNNKEISTLQENERYKVLYNLSIRESIEKLDSSEIGFITVVNDANKVLGIVTDGDFRRAVLSGISLDDPIISIANNKFTFLNEGYSKEEIEKIFFNNDIAHIPVLKNNELREIILRKNIPFIKNNIKKEKVLGVPIVIMAGGIGTRLKPFTHIMPKPLIPIGNKPLIEVIIDRFKDAGANEFYLSVNYKANMIKAYFEGRSMADSLKYIIEDFPMGTAGSLKKLKGIIRSTFIVSNCDIIIKSDYNKIIEFHSMGKYDLTLVACMHHFTIPYGICSIEEGGSLKEISEKPEFDYLVNTGMYIIEPDILDFIPENTFYHITQLIEDLKKNNRRIGVYPVYEKSWIDVGQWEEYRKAIKYFH